MGDQPTPAPVTVPEPKKTLTEHEIKTQLQANYTAFINDKDVQALMTKAQVKAAQIRVPSDSDVQKLPNKSHLRQEKFSKLTKEQQELVTRANEQGLAVVIPVGKKDFAFMPTKEQREAAATKKTNTQTTSDTDTNARAQAESEEGFSWEKWWENNSWWLKPLLFMLIGSVIGIAFAHALDKRDHATAASIVDSYNGGLGGDNGNKNDSNNNSNTGGGGNNLGGLIERKVDSR